MLLAFRSLYESAVAETPVLTHRLNSPTMAVRQWLEFFDPTGAGTYHPTVIPDLDTPDGYAIFDIGANYLIRTTRWQVEISITKTETLTHDITGDSWTWTESLGGTYSGDERTMVTPDPSLGVIPTTEKHFAQSTTDGVIANGVLTPDAIAFDSLDIVGTYGGTYTPAVGPPEPFSGALEATMQFATRGMHIVLTPAPLGLLEWDLFLTCGWGTPTVSPSMSPPEQGFALNTFWSIVTGPEIIGSSCKIRVPRWDGVGDVETETTLGWYFPPETPAPDLTRNSISFTASILLTPIGSLGYGGVWDTATGAPLLNPLTASI